MNVSWTYGSITVFMDKISIWLDMQIMVYK